MRKSVVHHVSWSHKNIEVSRRPAMWYGRGTGGRYREGDIGPIRKLVMQPQSGKELVGHGAVKVAANLHLPRSAGESQAAEERVNIRDAMREVIRRDAMRQLTKQKKVKVLDSFIRAFGSGGTGKGLGSRGDGVTTAAEIDKTTITGLQEEPNVRLKAFGDLKALHAPSLLTLALQGEGWSDPTPIQAHLWLLSQSTRDVVALSVPGSGKTAAYLVPAVLKALEAKRDRPLKDTPADPIVEPTVVVLVPTVELARQVHALALKLGHTCGIPVGLVAGKAGQLVESAGIVVATPFRLKKLITKGLVALDRMEMLVVDEADHMVAKHGNEIETIVLKKKRGEIHTLYTKKERDARPDPQRLQMLMIASTWSTESALRAESLLENPIVIRVGGDEPLPSVGHRLHVMPSEDRGPFIASMFTTDVLPYEKNQFIVFAETQADVEMLYDMLNSVLPFGVVCMMHEGMQEYARKITVEAFAEGKHRILVATDIVSRGIHFERVNAVVNYDIPPIEVLLQRLGRTGRGTRHGMCHTLVSNTTSKAVLEQLQATLHSSEHSIPIADLLKDDDEKSVFIKKLEMQSLTRPTSFDTV